MALLDLKCKVYGSPLERSEYQSYIEQNKKNIETNNGIYKQRQAIVEHPYGIIKRQWGFYYITTKRGIQRAGADVGLMFTAYNLRRLINIIDKNLLKKFLRDLCPSFFMKRTLLKAIKTTLIPLFLKFSFQPYFYKAT